MRESYCIICGEEKDGVEIRNDRVLDSIRWFKRNVMRAPNKNNRLVVCAACYPKYKTMRKKFLSRQRTYLVLGALFMIFDVIIARSPVALLMGVVVLALLYVPWILTYVPDLDYRSGGKGKGSSDGALRRAGQKAAALRRKVK